MNDLDSQASGKPAASKVDTPAAHWRRVVNAFGYSIKGFRAAYREEAAIRLEAWGLLIFLPCALLAPVPPACKAAMVISAMLVPLAELFNSAIEAVVDRIGTERHELSGRAKDIGSAAVFLAVADALLVWAVCLWPIAKAWLG